MEKYAAIAMTSLVKIGQDATNWMQKFGASEFAENRPYDVGRRGNIFHHV